LTPFESFIISEVAILVFLSLLNYKAYDIIS
jgi:hypothetical protein